MKLNENYQVLSCIQPTGDMHLGNYFGAIKNWVDLQDKYNCIYGVVDLHAITAPYAPAELKAKTDQMVLDILACGIDPEKSILFVQSLIPEHTELAWLFNCITSYGELSRMTQFKDKSQKQSSEGDGFISAGLFTYPVLQAADILIYRAKHIPVGMDQKQHLELSRNVAERFNTRFADYFPVPEPLFTQTPKIMSLADPSRKMSKSLGSKHYIGVFEDEKSIRKKVRSAVTDSGDMPDGEMSPGVANMFELLKACGKTEVVEHFMCKYEEGGLRYGDFKNAVADALVELTNGIKARRAELEADNDKLNATIREMSAKARAIAQETIREVKTLMGVMNV